MAEPGLRRIGILYPNQLTEAASLSEEVERWLRPQVQEVWRASIWESLIPEERLRTTDLLLVLGGDGTLLRAARLVSPWGVLLLGINVGRLGFLTELHPGQLLQQLPEILSGGGYIDERTMLQAELLQPAVGGQPPEPGKGPYHALNDVVVGRQSLGRPVYISVDVDGIRLAVYRADAVIVCTATGSTGYNLSSGGPIMHPSLREMLLTPVAPHLSLAKSLVLPPSSVVELRVATDHRAALTVDGQGDLELADGDGVRVTVSPHVARFLRLSPPSEFYFGLGRRLDSLTTRFSDRPSRGEMPTDPPDAP